MIHDSAHLSRTDPISAEHIVSNVGPVCIMPLHEARHETYVETGRPYNPLEQVAFSPRHHSGTVLLLQNLNDATKETYVVVAGKGPAADALSAGYILGVTPTVYAELATEDDDIVEVFVVEVMASEPFVRGKTNRLALMQRQLEHQLYTQEKLKRQSRTHYKGQPNV